MKKSLRCIISLVIFLNACLFPILSANITAVKAVNLIPGAVFVAPVANNGNGTINSPYNDLSSALLSLTAGKTLYLRGGTYFPTASITIQGKNGTANAPINVFAYPGEAPIIDFSKVYIPNYWTFDAINMKSNYWNFKGFTLQNVPSVYRAPPETSTYQVTAFGLWQANNCTIENVTVCHIEGGGLTIGYTSTNNLIKNCDFYDCHDKYSPTAFGPGGNANGLTIIGTDSNTTNMVVGCRAWYISDDGFDLWGSAGEVIMEDCWAFLNGYDYETTNFLGDGNGFKLGKSDTTGPPRQIRRCVSAYNATCGYTDNGAKNKIYFEHNLAYGNGAKGTSEPCPGFNCFTALDDVLYNNVLVGSPLNCTVRTIQVGNSWQTGNAINASAFVSTDVNLMLAQRQADGSLPKNDIFRPVAKGPLHDAGSMIIPSGIQAPTYEGNAPDLGPFEISGSAIPVTPTPVPNTPPPTPKSTDHDYFGVVAMVNVKTTGTFQSTLQSLYGYSSPSQYHVLYVTTSNGAYITDVELQYIIANFTNVEEMYLSGADYDSTKEFGGFTGFKYLKTLTLFKNIKTFKTWGSIYGLPELTGDITLPNSVETLGYMMFDTCPKLTGTLTMPNNPKLTSFGGIWGKFSKVILPNNFTTIADYAMQNVALKGVATLPSSITTLNNWCFGTNALKDVTALVMQGNTPPTTDLLHGSFAWWDITKRPSTPENNYKENCYLIVAKGSNYNLSNVNAPWTYFNLPMVDDLKNITAETGITIAPQYTIHAGGMEASTLVSLTYTGINGTNYAASTTPPTSAGTYQMSASITNYESMGGPATATLTLVAKQTPVPTPVPTPEITPVVTPDPTTKPTPEITPVVTPEPTPGPTPEITPVVTPEPTPEPTIDPTATPTPTPTSTPTPTPNPSATPTPTLKPTPTPTPLPKPTGVTAVSASYNSIRISWNAVPRAAGYAIERSTSSSGPYIVITHITATSYINSLLTTGTTYFYRVKAYTLVNNVKKYGALSAITSAKPLPPTPILSYTKISGKIKLSWKGISGANGYEIYRCATSTTGTYTYYASTVNLTYTATAMLSKKPYYYRVRAYRLINKVKVCGGFSNIVYYH